MIEGEAKQVSDEAKLMRIAAAYEKYGSDWHFDVRDGAFHHGENSVAIVFEVAPATVFGFGKGEYSQTRWRFG